MPTPDWEKAEQDPKGLNVKRIGGSGSGVLKGDQVGPHILVEIKITKHRSKTVDLNLMRKVQREAAEQGKMPVIRFDLNHGYPGEQSVAILPWDVFLLLMEQADEG